MDQDLTVSNSCQVNVPLSIFNADCWNKWCLPSITPAFHLQWPDVQRSVRSKRPAQTRTLHIALPEPLFLPRSIDFWLHMSAQALLGTNKSKIKIMLHLLWLVCDIVRSIGCVHTHSYVVKDVEDAGLRLFTAMPHLNHKPGFVHDV